jgi:hypothetical protein
MFRWNVGDELVECSSLLLVGRPGLILRLAGSGNNKILLNLPVRLSTNRLIYTLGMTASAPESALFLLQAFRVERY